MGVNDRRHPRHGRRRRTNWTWYLGVAAVVVAGVTALVLVTYRDQMPWRTTKVSIDGPGTSTTFGFERVPPSSQPGR